MLTKCSSPPSVAADAVEKPVAATVESLVVIIGLVLATAELPLSEALQSWLQPDALL